MRFGAQALKLGRRPQVRPKGWILGLGAIASKRSLQKRELGLEPPVPVPQGGKRVAHASEPFVECGATCFAAEKAGAQEACSGRARQDEIESTHHALGCRRRSSLRFSTRANSPADSSARRRVMLAPWRRWNASTSDRKIGRASCRERVEEAGVEVRVIDE